MDTGLMSITAYAIIGLIANLVLLIQSREVFDRNGVVLTNEEPCVV